MARTQALDYDQKRELITQEASKLFAKKGFGGASLSDLAAACKTSKSLIYHYYDSKEAILYDVMIAHMADLLSVRDEIENRQVSAQEKFQGFARVLMRHYVGAADSQKILVYEINNLPKTQQEEIIDQERQLISYAEDLLHKARPKPKGETGTPNQSRKTLIRTKIMLFFGMLNWTHTWYRSDGPIDRDDIADIASKTILESLELKTEKAEQKP